MWQCTTRLLLKLRQQRKDASKSRRNRVSNVSRSCFFKSSRFDRQKTSPREKGRWSVSNFHIGLVLFTCCTKNWEKMLHCCDWFIAVYIRVCCDWLAMVVSVSFDFTIQARPSNQLWRDESRHALSLCSNKFRRNFLLDKPTLYLIVIFACSFK